MDLEKEQRRRAVELIFRRTLDAQARRRDLEVLTVDNHTDAAFLLLWARENMSPDDATKIERLLARNGGNSSGKGIGCIDERGSVHPDQFWRTRTLGNVRERPFSAIWTDETIPLLAQLGDRHSLLPQKCAECRFLSICNGNLRARAEAATGELWGDDPACYLTDEEIGVAGG